MRKTTKAEGLLIKQVLRKWRSMAIAAIPIVFLLVTTSITPKANTITAKMDRAEAVKATKNAKPGLSKGCIPEPGTEAYRKLMSPTGPGAPPPPIRRVGYHEVQTDSEDSQWCWKQSCEHIEWVCSQGDAEDVNGCCVRCCWEGTEICSESRCCDSRME